MQLISRGAGTIVDVLVEVVRAHLCAIFAEMIVALRWRRDDSEASLPPVRWFMASFAGCSRI